MESLVVIARIHNGFLSKFGIPRQSGLVGEVLSYLVFEKKYRDQNALRGIEGYSHLWLLWGFSENKRTWSPTVRPPRLGGNKRVGVFATRSPFRPNPIGLSCVQLVDIQKSQDQGEILVVSGADLMDGTPIYDIKPYLAFTDSHPEASGGFADAVKGAKLSVVFPENWLFKLPVECRAAVCGILEQDPRPAYQSDAARIYKMEYGGFRICFCVADRVLTVVEVEKV